MEVANHIKGKKGKKLTKNSKLLFKVCHICIGQLMSIIDYCNFKTCIGVWHPLIMTKLPFFGLSICCDPCSFFDFLFAFATLLFPCYFCCCKDFAFGLRSFAHVFAFIVLLIVTHVTFITSLQRVGERGSNKSWNPTYMHGFSSTWLCFLHH